MNVETTKGKQYTYTTDIDDDDYDNRKKSKATKSAIKKAITNFTIG